MAFGTSFQDHIRLTSSVSITIARTGPVKRLGLIRQLGQSRRRCATCARVLELEAAAEPPSSSLERGKSSFPRDGVRRWGQAWFARVTGPSAFVRVIDFVCVLTYVIC